jgi:hypothetical protein
VTGFSGQPRHYDLEASVAASRQQWWGTPRYRDQMTVGDRVWLQAVGSPDAGIGYGTSTVRWPGGSGRVQMASTSASGIVFGLTAIVPVLISSTRDGSSAR